ncbi:MAG: alpha/beta hydrolase [Candidatus Dojkabacteria bacterium]
MREKIAAAIVAVLILLTAAPYIFTLPSDDYRKPEQLAGFNSLFDTINGVKIHYEIYGDPVNPAVILIHGFGGSTFTWRDTIPALLENKFYVVALDLKGFGLSERGINLDYSHESQANLVNDLMDNLGIKEAFIVGHSMGGNVATFLTELHPEKVRKLILVDAQIFRPNYDIIKVSQVSQLITVFPFDQYARQILLRYITPSTVRNILSSAYYDKDLVTDYTVDGYAQSLKIKDWQESLIGIIRDQYKNNLPNPLEKIEKPVRIIWGLQDTWINLEEGKKINIEIKGSVMDVIENAGHMPMEESPEDFNAILLKDLK